MARTIVVLGASYAGVPIAHYLLKHTAARVEGLKVIIVAPNTHLYWCVASIRGILPNMMPDEKLFYPIAPAFAKYPSERYELVRGVAERVDPAGNIVEVRGNDGSSRTIHYDELVIATGSSARAGMPFKSLSSTDETKKSLHEWAERIRSAKSIVVAGAGITGIEVAGELGQEYGITGQKQITLIADGDLPLSSNIKLDVRQTAKKELERLKVKVITNTKVTTPPSPSAKTITLTSTSSSSQSKTTTLQADLLIPTYGITPNTSFLPPSMLDARGFVNQTTRLRAQGHDNIFVVGDAGNLESPQGVHNDRQVVHVVKLIEARILGQPKGGEEEEYKPDEKIMFGATLGRKNGTGQMGDWRIWGWLIWWMKSRHLITDAAGPFVNGERTMTVKGW